MKPSSLGIALTGLACALSACSQQAQPTAENPESSTTSTAVAPPASSVAAHADWAGKWIGPEGMFVEIAPTAAGKYDLEMQSDLDTRGTYSGADAEGGITFTRAGKQLLLKAASGDETGLKYLAGKTDCLMVKTGEGYCRDN